MGLNNLTLYLRKLNLFIMHDKHQEFFDKLAVEWDLMYTAEDLERLSHIISKIEIKEGIDILDLGCGTGVLFDLLRRRITPSGSVTGVDFSIEMAEKAHRNFPFDNVFVVDADVINLPFEESSFELAFAFNAFPHFSDKQIAIEEIHRVLKNGAKFYIIHLESSKDIAEVHRKIGGAVEHDEIPPKEKLKQMFDVSEFVNVCIEDKPGLYITHVINSK
ncbi:MAG: hypothetical protein DRP35_04775 [Candidatus Zixiibacteriota bacterium]|nr:MAG: hypothetical protein DRP35_04775 [candidate division Zixibacteria bacterium]